MFKTGFKNRQWEPSAEQGQVQSYTYANMTLGPKSETTECLNHMCGVEAARPIFGNFTVFAKASFCIKSVHRVQMK